MDIYEQAMQAADMIEVRESIRGTAELAGVMRDSFLAYGFTRDEAVALTAEWLADVREA